MTNPVCEWVKKYVKPEVSPNVMLIIYLRNFRVSHIPTNGWLPERLCQETAFNGVSGVKPLPAQSFLKVSMPPGWTWSVRSYIPLPACRCAFE